MTPELFAESLIDRKVSVCFYRNVLGKGFFTKSFISGCFYPLTESNNDTKIFHGAAHIGLLKVKCLYREKNW